MPHPPLRHRNFLPKMPRSRNFAYGICDMAGNFWVSRGDVFIWGPGTGRFGDDKEALIQEIWDQLHADDCTYGGGHMLRPPLLHRYLPSMLAYKGQLCSGNSTRGASMY
jgi:hypothetical protein